MSGHSERKPDFARGVGTAPQPPDASLPVFSPGILGREGWDRLHSARARLNSTLDRPAVGPRMLLHMERGESPCTQGQEADFLFLVQRGLLKLSLVSREGTQSIPEIVGAGDCFGEECVEEGSPHYAETATALTSSVLAKVARQHVLRRLEEEPEFAKLYIATLVYRVHEYEEFLAQHVFENSEQRLARALARLTKFGQWQNRDIVVLPRLTHETLSEMVGTTRSRVTFFIGRLAHLGILTPGPRLCINVQRLFEEVLRQPRNPQNW
jgi:CRP/FNR family transcriptional regulator, cyclic AMP receptor protein